MNNMSNKIILLIKWRLVVVRIILTDEESKLLKQFLLYFSMEEYNGFLGELNNKREGVDELLIDIYNQISEIIE